MKKLLIAFLALITCTSAWAQTPTTPAIAAMVCANNTVVPTPVNGKFFYVQCDANGKLLTNASGGGSSTITAGTTATSGIASGNLIGSSGNLAVDSGLAYANIPTLNGSNTFSGANAYGTPASITLTNATGLPIATGISGLGSGCATFLATPSSANLASCITNETGTGLAVFNAAPTFATSITDPLVIGGVAAGSVLTLRSTSSGSPSADSVQIGASAIYFQNAAGSGNPFTVLGNGGVVVGGFSATAANGELALAKISASGTAPSAGFCKIAVVQGTGSTCNAGIACGTVITPVVFATNVGGSC